MKKFIFASVLIFGMISGLWANSTADVQFDQYVEMTRKSPSNPAGMTVSSDRKYHIIYAAMPIGVNYAAITPAVQKEMKKAMVTEFKKFGNDLKIVKDLKISMVYTFITTDGYPVVIALSYKDI